MKKVVVIWSIILLIIACKTSRINEQTQHLSTQQLELGLIGVERTDFTNTVFETISIPILKQKIRVQVSSTAFSKSTYKAFRKALVGKNLQEGLKLVDSVRMKPVFLSLTLLDHIGYLDELNKEVNSSIINYVKHLENVGVTTAISAVFDPVKQQQLLNAEEVYLVNAKHKQYTLEVVDKNKQKHAIELSDEVVFGYQLSYFCWGQSDRNKVAIVNMRNKLVECQRGTQENPQKLIKKVNHFKFSKR